jgi:hypothetical protein
MTSTVSTANDPSVPEAVVLLPFPPKREEEEEGAPLPRPLPEGKQRLAILFAIVFIAAAIALALLVILEIAGNIYAAVHHCQSRTLACIFFESCTPRAANKTLLLADCPGDAIPVLEIVLGCVVALPFLCAAGA